MNLPIIGYVTQQAMLLGFILLLCCAYGFIAGMSRSAKMLAACLLALGISVIPPVHDFIAELLNIVVGRKAGHAAYLLTYVALLLVFKTLPLRIPGLKRINPPRLDKILGIFSGALQAFAHLTMLLVLLYGFRLPWSGLYARSEIASFICQVWQKIGLLPELYALQFLNPGTLF